MIFLNRATAFSRFFIALSKSSGRVRRYRFNGLIGFACFSLSFHDSNAALIFLRFLVEALQNFANGVAGDNGFALGQGCESLFELIRGSCRDHRSPMGILNGGFRAES